MDCFESRADFLTIIILSQIFDMISKYEIRYMTLHEWKIGGVDKKVL